MKNYQTNKEAYVSRVHVQPQFSETSDAIDRFSQRHEDTNFYHCYHL